MFPHRLVFATLERLMIDANLKRMRRLEMKARHESLGVSIQLSLSETEAPKRSPIGLSVLMKWADAVGS